MNTQQFFTGNPTNPKKEKMYITRGSAHFVDCWHGDASYWLCEDSTPGSMVEFSDYRSF